MVDALAEVMCGKLLTLGPDQPPSVPVTLSGRG
jgi:hypothetical protein